MERKPDVTDEEVGIQHFHLRKGRAVERSLEKIRHGLEKDFTLLTFDDIKVLEWTLGETWAMMGFFEWNKIPFSTMKLDEVKKIIKIGREITSHKKKGVKGIEEVNQILKKLTHRYEQEQQRP